MSSLPVWCCGNPTCPVAHRGRPRVLFSGQLAPGTVVESLPCRVCRWVTRVAIDADGRSEISCRPAQAATRQEGGRAVG